MRKMEDRTPAEQQLFKRIVQPDKADGTALVAEDFTEDEWATLRCLLIADDVRLHAEDGRTYIQPNATVSELVEAGYLG